MAAVGVVGALAVGVAPAAAAADLIDAGWWWRPQSGQLVPLPPPPGVPEGGLFVQGAVDGATAIAAVRYVLGADETAPVLTLRISEDGPNQGAEAAIVLACSTTTPWNSGSAQPWDRKPVPDCSRQAVGTLAEDATTLAFDLSAVAAGPLIDVVLLPGTVEDRPEGLDGSAFTLVFEAPADGDLATQPARVSTAPVSPTGSGFSPSPSSGGGGGGGSGGGAAFVPGSTAGSFTPPAAPVAPALPADEVATGSEQAGGAPAAPPPTVPPTFVPVSAPDTGGARAFAVTVLVLAAVGAVIASRRDQVLHLLGRHPEAAPVPVSGLGRFARERPGPPPSLR